MMDAESDRQKKQSHNRQRPDTGFNDSPDDEPPDATYQVMQHQQRQTSQRHTKPKQIGNQIRPVKLRRVEENADDASGRADNAGHEKPAPQPFELWHAAIHHRVLSSSRRSSLLRLDNGAFWLS